MPYSEDAAVKSLAQIKAPGSDDDLVRGGYLSDLSFEDGTLRAVLKIDPQKAQGFEALTPEIKTRLGQLPGVEQVQVILTAHKAGPDIKSQTQSRRNPHPVRRPAGYQGDAFIDHIIAVSSAKGGVGKSTLAVNLAVALARQGKKVGILDADIHGPSIPMLLGLSGETAQTREVEGRRLIAPLSRSGISAMSIGFLTPDDGPVVWRGPMVQGAISKMLWDVDWGHLDILIVDMPPGTGDAQLGLAQDIRPRGAIIVTTPQDLALADAGKGIAMFDKVGIPVLGLVENMSVFTCPSCGSAHHIFGDGGGAKEAAARGVTLLGEVPLHMRVRQSSDDGEPIAAQDVPEARSFEGMAETLIEILDRDV